jgi:muramoyltetrapeptide carboxypeptidase
VKIFPPDFTIAVTSPAGPAAAETVASGMETLQKLWARVKLMPHIQNAASPHRFLSAGDDERAADLMAAWRDPEVSLILAVRGGYGCVRILEKLDWEFMASRPLPVAGFSDITSLHWAMTAKKCGIPVAMPMFSFLKEPDSGTIASMAKIFTGAPQEFTLPALRSGNVSALPLPGNLTVAASLCGTPYFPDTAGKIVILEEVRENSPYRIDRLLTQLRLAGTFDRAAGVVFGYFTACGNDDELMAVLKDFTSKIDIPVFYGLQFGHEQPFTSIRCDRMFTVNPL